MRYIRSLSLVNRMQASNAQESTVIMHVVEADIPTVHFFLKNNEQAFAHITFELVYFLNNERASLGYILGFLP